MFHYGSILLFSQPVTLNEGEEAEPDEEDFGVVEDLQTGRFAAAEAAPQVLIVLVN